MLREDSDELKRNANRLSNIILHFGKVMIFIGSDEANKLSIFRGGGYQPHISLHNVEHIKASAGLITLGLKDHIKVVTEYLIEFPQM